MVLLIQLVAIIVGGRRDSSASTAVPCEIRYAFLPVEVSKQISVQYRTGEQLNDKRGWVPVPVLGVSLNSDPHWPAADRRTGRIRSRRVAASTVIRQPWHAWEAHWPRSLRACRWPGSHIHVASANQHTIWLKCRLFVSVTIIQYVNCL